MGSALWRGAIAAVAATATAIGAITIVVEEPADLHASVASDGSAAPSLIAAPDHYAPTPGSAALPDVPDRPLPFDGPVRDKSGEQDRFQPFRIYGDDDERVPVPFPHGYPERAIVHIHADGSTAASRCTGWLIGDDTVVTAGHCVHRGGDMDAEWAPLARIVVRSSIDGESAAPSTSYRSCGARRLYSTTGWVRDGEDGPEEYDYGAIKLDCALGALVGTLGISIVPLPWVKTDPPHVIGYDNNTTAAGCKYIGTWVHLCHGPGTLATASGGLLFYDADTETSQSGAPIIVPAECSTCAVGIHTRSYHGSEEKHGKFNHGTLMTERVFRNLQAWRNATAR